ncbi:hypothetical protein M0654_06900 [Rhizobium sp. NTR19]|uniref:Uncharacterized protein n=1 Tax=Neorhizobium turbinariae TaxID=2937795 RepID=A0ABT0IPC8_9HYPH|nr:hypothetical protein [Neorhizobium turbinariae]MCK8779713.1 hypothetical protein [Neorhizobium turbinariae]
MSDNSSKTVTARFETRAAAELAVEHLAQDHGIDRADIFVQPVGAENTSGTSPNGSDAPSVRDETRHDGANQGEIEVSADVPANEVAAVQRIFGDIGALHVSAG